MTTMGKVTCLICKCLGDSNSDNDQFTSYECVRWLMEKQRLEVKVGPMTPDNIVEVISDV